MMIRQSVAMGLSNKERTATAEMHPYRSDICNLRHNHHHHRRHRHKRFLACSSTQNVQSEMDLCSCIIKFVQPEMLIVCQRYGSMIASSKCNTKRSAEEKWKQAVQFKIYPVYTGSSTSSSSSSLLFIYYAKWQHEIKHNTEVQ